MTDPKLSTKFLKNINLFRSISPEILRPLMKTVQLVELPADHVVCREGDRGDGLYIILDGDLAVYKSMGTPEEQFLNPAGPGDFLGEMSLFDVDGVRAASVVTTSPIWMLKITREDFNQLIHTEPELAFEISKVLTQRVRNNLDDLEEKNNLLEQALKDLRAAQADLIIKERLERELEVARQIQEDILPRELPVYSGFDFGAKMIPARAVGGDFFDFIPLSEHRTGIVIGDVSDKGVPAAIFMALTRSLVRAEATRTGNPRLVLERVNRLLSEMSKAAMFVTILYGILDCENRVFHYARAGHEIPIFVNADGQESMLPQNPGQPVALFEELLLDEQTVELPPKTMLLMYTDGMTDATDPEESFFGLNRLRVLAGSSLGSSAQELVENILYEIKAHQGDSPQYDDMTLITIHSHE